MDSVTLPFIALVICDFSLPLAQFWHGVVKTRSFEDGVAMKKKRSVSEVLYVGMGKFVVFQNLNCTAVFLQDVDGC